MPNSDKAKLPKKLPRGFSWKIILDLVWNWPERVNKSRLKKSLPSPGLKKQLLSSILCDKDGLLAEFWYIFKQNTFINFRKTNFRVPNRYTISIWISWWYYHPEILFFVAKCIIWVFIFYENFLVICVSILGFTKYPFPNGTPSQKGLLSL